MSFTASQSSSESRVHLGVMCLFSFSLAVPQAFFDFHVLGIFEGYRPVVLSCSVMTFKVILFPLSSTSTPTPFPQHPAQILMLQTSLASFFLCRVQRKAPFADKPPALQLGAQAPPLPPQVSSAGWTSSLNTRHQHVDKELMLLCWAWWLKL